jgi:hypothetical protein
MPVEYVRATPFGADMKFTFGKHEGFDHPYAYIYAENLTINKVAYWGIRINLVYFACDTLPEGYRVKYQIFNREDGKDASWPARDKVTNWVTKEAEMLYREQYDYITLTLSSEASKLRKENLIAEHAKLCKRLLELEAELEALS